MARHAPLSIHMVPGDQLTEAQIDEMWRLRRRIFALKPERDEATDRASFAKRVRIAQRNLHLRDTEGVLRGMWSVHWRLSPDERVMWALPEYGFLDPDHRGHPALVSGAGRIFLRVLWEARGRPVWLGGIGYPRTYQTIERALGRTWLLADEDAPPEAKRLLLAMHELFAADTWDRERGDIWLPTIPETVREGYVKGESWRRFEAACPRWEEGYALGLVAPIGFDLVVRWVRELLGRGKRR